MWITSMKILLRIKIKKEYLKLKVDILFFLEKIYKSILFIINKLLTIREKNNIIKKSYNYAPLAQLVEQQTLNLMVGGSIPLWRTIDLSNFKIQINLFFYLKSNLKRKNNEKIYKESKQIQYKYN